MEEIEKLLDGLIQTVFQVGYLTGKGLVESEQCKEMAEQAKICREKIILIIAHSKSQIT